ncbi:DUF4214 domain-containing protein [Massilia endophytica]|nr:DUF4214 domain-containing protein [Massilia endophytica]
MRYGGSRADHSIGRTAEGFTVTARNAQHSDTLLNSERIAFGDLHVALDIDGVGGQAYRLYQAALNRQPDHLGLGFWIAKMDDGMSLHGAAAGFMASPEFAGLYGSADPEPGAFLTRLYSNVLHRAPDQPGYEHFLREFARGVSKAEVLAIFSESEENRAQLIGAMQNGVEYLLYNA